ARARPPARRPWSPARAARRRGFRRPAPARPGPERGAGEGRRRRDAPDRVRGAGGDGWRVRASAAIVAAWTTGGAAAGSRAPSLVEEPFSVVLGTVVTSRRSNGRHAGSGSASLAITSFRSRPRG